jgi:hypothetical protein
MINYERLYEFRFRNVDQASRERVWREISADIHRRMGQPDVVLDPAAGRGEFIRAVPARERWTVDFVDQAQHLDPTIHAITADIFDADLPRSHFDGVFVSNFLEHLASQEAIAGLLSRLRSFMVTGGRIAVLGPNFKYASREYFDCADHVIPLTHVAVEEHLYAAGFAIESVIPRYLPFSFRGILPPSPALTRQYLRWPLLWRFLGRQFLVVARNDD